MYKINEIFYSLQGEGRWAGTPMVFIRFSGCNLRCGFCDTDFIAFKEMGLEDIVSLVERISGACQRICVTGGEPSLQIDEAFVSAFHKKGYKIHIETNGTRSLPEGIDWVTFSPKQDLFPDSPLALEKADELKLVYTGSDPKHWEDFPAGYYYLQPCSCLNTEEVVAYVMDHPLWQLSLQTHKYIDIR